MLERGFLIFRIILLFFSEFSFPSRVWTELGTKIVLSHPVLSNNSARKRFFNFLNLFAIFFSNFLARVEYERNSGLYIFFVYFSAYLIPFSLEIMPERGFLIFCIFLLFFSEFSLPGRVWMEFGTKFFFSLSRPISSRFG